ncbi:MAG: hypothetical protein IJR70_08825 [Eubacterium sp.]|nr:hypothetical protein [Eubacterium sp.]
MKKSIKKLTSLMLSLVLIASALSAVPFVAKAATSWTPIASSDFTQVTAVSNGSLGEVPTYNGMGNTMTWSTGVWTGSGNAENSSDGAVYIPDGYMYLSGYSGNCVPINGHSKWKIDFGFRFKTTNSGDDKYYNSDNYSFMKSYVYTGDLEDPAQKNNAYCHFAQNANGVIYSWENDGHNGGTQSQATSITTGNGNLSAGVNYHYVAEFTGTYLRTYITDDNGLVVQEIAHSTDATLMDRLDNSGNVRINSFKIGDDDKSYYFKGLEYRNITFYSGDVQDSDPAPSSTEDKYLFTYFTGNSNEGEKLRYAVSEDGINFTALNNGEAVTEVNVPESGEGLTVYPTGTATSAWSTGHIRDPYAFKAQDGSYYILATDLNTVTAGFNNNSKMLVWHLDDLEDIDEVTPWAIDVTGMFNAGWVYRAWAPEAIWDPVEQKYMLYFAARTSQNGETVMYYVYTSDFKTFTSTPKRLVNYGNADNIDGDITYNPSDHLYYLWYKNENNSTLGYATSPTCCGPYMNTQTISANVGLEGCQVHQLTDGTYVLLADAYGNGCFKVYTSNTLSGFSEPVASNISTLNARHGSVVRITTTQYNNLVAKFGLAEPKEIKYNFDIDVNGTGWIGTRADSCGYGYQISAQGTNGLAYSTSDNNYISLYGANLFVNDQAVRNIMASPNFTSSFNATVSSTTGTALWGLCSGTSGSVTDWVQILDNGKVYLNSGSGLSEAGSFTIETAVENTFHIVSDGTNLKIYKNGEQVFTHAWTNKFDNSMEIGHIGLGYTDANGVAARFKGSVSALRVTAKSLTASEVASEYSEKLYYQFNSGSETLDGMPNAINASSGLTDTYKGSKVNTFTVAGWVNPGNNVGGGPMFFFGNGGKGASGQYFTLRENGTLNYQWGDGTNEHYVDINGVGPFSANTWYYVQVNVIPYKNTVRIKTWVNGAEKTDSWLDNSSTYAGGTNLTEALSNMPINMMSQSSVPVCFGKYSDGTYDGWGWGGDGSSYICDFRVYGRAMNAEDLYNSANLHYEGASAKEYVLTNLDQLSDSASFTAQPKHEGDGINSNAYANYAYASNTSSWSGNGSTNTANGVGRLSFKLAFPRYNVLVYDGATTPVLPVFMESFANETGGSAYQIKYFQLNNATDLFEFNQNWKGYTTTWNRWPGNIDMVGTQEFSWYSGGTKSSEDHRDTNSRFWWNKLTYKGSGNTDTYYDHASNIEVYGCTKYHSGTSDSDKYGSVYGLTDVYVINYKPIHDILNGGSDLAYYNANIKNKEDQWTEDSLNQWYIAMSYLLKANPNNYSYSDCATDVATCASYIKKAIAAYDKAYPLVERADFSGFNTDYNSALDYAATLGGANQAYTTTSLTNLQNVIDGLYYAPDDGSPYRPNIKKSVEQSAIDAEEDALEDAIAALDPRANVATLTSSFDTADTFLKGLEGQDATYTEDSIQDIIDALGASGVSTYYNADTTDLSGNTYQTTINSLESAISTAYAAREAVNFSAEAKSGYEAAYAKITKLDPDTYEENQEGSIAAAKRSAEALFTTATYGSETINVVTEGVASSDMDHAITTMLSALTTCIKRYTVSADSGVAEIAANDGEYKNGKATFGTKLTFTASDPETVWYLDVDSGTTHRKNAFQGFGDKLEVKTVGNVTVITKTRGANQKRVRITRTYDNATSQAIQLVDFVDGSFGLPAAPALAYYNFSGYYLKGSDERLDNPSNEYPQNISISADTEIVAKYTYNGEASCAVNATTLEGGSASIPDAVAYNTRIELKGGTNAYGWSVNLGNGSYRPFYVGADLTMYATDSMNLVAEDEATFNAHGYALPNIYLRSGTVSSGTKTIFNAQVVAADMDKVKESGILVAVANGKQPGSAETVDPVTPTDSQITVENSGQQTGFAVLRAKSTKYVGANQISIAVNSLPNGYAYRGYLIYEDSEGQLQTVYTDVIR